ncbi:CLUMA_CG006128, isoform A [Clunio marinus]|uniref:CLUMA_CG006128, isoform A n=1 Tax=Clunio marinus TaxID=568069 RepID=A0A1J1HWX5_9DIPT|nr:CLUMA_CG006128, isoform A [Clunio marinus]
MTRSGIDMVTMRNVKLTRHDSRWQSSRQEAFNKAAERSDSGQRSRWGGKRQKVEHFVNCFMFARNNEDSSMMLLQ